MKFTFHITVRHGCGDGRLFVTKGGDYSKAGWQFLDKVRSEVGEDVSHFSVSDLLPQGSLSVGISESEARACGRLFALQAEVPIAVEEGALEPYVRVWYEMDDEQYDVAVVTLTCDINALAGDIINNKLDCWLDGDKLSITKEEKHEHGNGN